MKYISLLLLSTVCFFACKQSKEEVKSALPKPSGSCSYSRDEKDPVGRRIRMVDEQKFILLEFTDSATREAYKNEDFFKGYLSCMNVDSILGIYFRFNIHSDDAFQYYGMIKKGNKIVFILKSGKAVELPFGATFSGNTDLSKEFTEYSSFAYLPKNASELLQSEELQRVRIFWSKKDEEYVVANPNVFINQLPCVK
ncbi:MAG: hypothetical protein HY841_05070 [Bacteroidetes bacterium]|nr:hypothetical protein [Bacteroidota bacterium]